jgi:RNA polymerase sigma factor (sigma-70 family)
MAFKILPPSPTTVDVHSLVEAVRGGDRESFPQLIQFCQRTIFNSCQKFYLSPEDAEDSTQEILIKIITKLDRFDENQGSFSTWILSIAKYHLIDVKRKKGRMESQVGSYQEYFDALDQVPDEHLADPNHISSEARLLAMEANVSCMLGMLLCLERDQRLVLILGDILGIESAEAARVMGITAVNFRKKLSRARKELYSFMQNRCGLVNKSNPCRCHKKAQGFRKAGWLDPVKHIWVDEHYHNSAVFSEEHAEEAFEKLQERYADQFKALPVYDSEKDLIDLESIIRDKEINFFFNLHENES